MSKRDARMLRNDLGARERYRHTPKWIAFVLAALPLCGPAFASEIREFKVATLEKLGNELCHRDDIAAKAEDLVLAKYPDAKAIRIGWITELHADGDIVYLLMRKDEDLALAYTVSFPRKGPSVVKDRRGQPLPASVALHFKARQTAMAAARDKLFAGVTYNFEVLDDPDGKGFLVYGLASTNKPDEQITGGHFRITVSADGSKAERVDALSHGIIIGTPEDVPNGTKTVGLGTTNLVSNIPVETFLYSSHLYRIPISVATKDGAIWLVVNGKIHKFSKAELAAMEKAAPPKR